MLSEAFGQPLSVSVESAEDESADLEAALDAAAAADAATGPDAATATDAPSYDDYIPADAGFTDEPIDDEDEDDEE